MPLALETQAHQAGTGACGPIAALEGLIELAFADLVVQDYAVAQAVCVLVAQGEVADVLQADDVVEGCVVHVAAAVGAPGFIEDERVGVVPPQGAPLTPSWSC